MQRFIIVFNFLEMRLARPYTEGKFSFAFPNKETQHEDRTAASSCQ